MIHLKLNGRERTFDAIVSPDNVRDQFESAAVFGTSLALFSERELPLSKEKLV